MKKEKKKKVQDIPEGEIGCLSEYTSGDYENRKSITVAEYKGKVRCNIRTWYRKEGDTTWLPGKGVTLDADEIETIMDEELLETALEKMSKEDKKK